MDRVDVSTESEKISIASFWLACLLVLCFYSDSALAAKSEREVWMQSFNQAKKLIDSQKNQSVKSAIEILAGIDDERAKHLQAVALISTGDEISIRSGMALMNALPDRSMAFLMSDTSVVELKMIEAVLRYLPGYEDNRNIFIQVPFAINGWHSKGVYDKSGSFVHSEAAQKYVSRIFADGDKLAKDSCLALGGNLRSSGPAIVMASKAETVKQRNEYISQDTQGKIKRCAENGWPEYQNIYGMILRNQNKSMSRDWVYKSVLGNHAPAAYNLVVLSLIDGLKDGYFSAALRLLEDYSGEEIAFNYLYNRITVAFSGKEKAEQSFRRLMGLSGLSGEVELFTFHLLARNFIQPDKGLITSSALDFNSDFDQSDFESWVEPLVASENETAMQYHCTYQIANYRYRSALIDKAMSVCGKYAKQTKNKALVLMYKQLQALDAGKGVGVN